MLAPFGVVPVLVGPLQTLLALLPSLLLGVGTSLLALFKPTSFKRLLVLLWSQKLAVAVIAGLVASAVYFHGALLPPVVEAVSASDAGNSAWPMFRGGPDRRGTAGDDPLRGGVQWSFSRDGIKTFYSSPAVVGNRVYAASADYGPLRDRGAIYSVDADTGKLVWEYSEGGYRATFSSPAVSGKYLVCGEGLHYTRDARIVCIDIEQSERERRGIKRWEFRTRNHVESSPCIAGDRVLVGAGDDGYYCLALEPDAAGQPVVLWHLDPKEYPDAECSPVAHDGKFYFGLGEDGQAICCVEAADGREVWRLPTPYPVFGCPSIAAGKLYVGMGNGNYIESAEQVAAKQIEKLKKAGQTAEELAAAAQRLRAIGEVWCVDLPTHRVAWKFPVGKTILGAVAVAEERVYFGSSDGNLYCLSTEGQLLRQWNAHAPIIASPAVGNRHVHVATQTGQLYALNSATLQLVWETRVDSGGLLFSSPAVARGHVYLGTTGNGLVCVGQASRSEEKPFWAGHLGGPGKSGWTEGSLVAPRGVFAWRYPAAKEDASEQGAAPEAPVIHTPLAYLDRDIFVGLNYANRPGLACLTLAVPLAAEPVLRWFQPMANPVYLSAAATEDVAFCVDGKPGDDGRQLHGLDPRTGKVRWQRPVDSAASGQLLLTTTTLFVADRAEGLSCFTAAGERVWSMPVGSTNSVPLLLGDILVVATAEPPALAALDAPTGAELWRTRLSAKPETGPVAAGDSRIWVGTAEGVSAFDLVGGQHVVEIKCGAMRGCLVADGLRLVGVAETREIVLIDPAQGKELQRIPGARADLPPVLAGDVLLYADQRSIQRFDLATRQATRWMDVAWLGGVTAPMTVRDAHVLFATKRGLVCAKPSK
ncbi:MAG: PQQ-binding-like beta-propeller repeat protein [Planctomycetia bacterium]|nr:PQQ-binding-like beta-propeller repeat protein [Planctomycetia bacterium]